MKKTRFLFLLILSEKLNATRVDKRDIRRICGDKFSQKNCTLKKCTDCSKQITFLEKNLFAINDPFEHKSLNFLTRLFDKNLLQIKSNLSNISIQLKSKQEKIFLNNYKYIFKDNYTLSNL